MDQENSTAENTTTDGGSDLPPNAPVVSGERQSGQHQDGSAKEQKPRKRWVHYYESIPRIKPEWIVAVATVFIAGAAISQYYMSKKQWETANKGLEVARENSRAAMKAAETAEKALESSNESFNRTLEQMRRQSAAMEGSTAAAKQSAQVATTALESSSNAFRLEMRPYVTVEKVWLKEFPKEGVSITVAVEIRNAGRTPGLGLRVAHKVDLQSSLPCQVRPLEFSPDTASSSEIGAGSTRGPIETSLGPALSKSEAGAINASKLFICHYGLIRYSDVLGGLHETETCAFWNAQRSHVALTACPHHNEAR